MAERNVRRDSADHLYSEFYMSKDERIRVTYRDNAEWAGGRALRIQKINFAGKPIQGPEFPAGKALDLIRAIFDVLPDDRETSA
jgi:hypothetical protein